MKNNTNFALKWLFICGFTTVLLGCSATATNADKRIVKNNAAEKHKQTEPQSEGLTTYDVVLNNGRVMDPESGFDAVRNVGITAGKITAISTQTLNGNEQVDATGKVISAGFIDIHNHSPSPLGFDYQVQDGVTSTMDLEVGASPVNEYGSLIEAKPRINFGASSSALYSRVAVMSDVKISHVLGKPVKNEHSQPMSRSFTQQASPAEIKAIRAKMEQGLLEGGIGIGLPLDYISIAVKQDELDMIFGLAAQYAVPIFIHVRRGLAGDSAGLDEALAMATKHKVSMLVCHLSHSAMQNTPQFLSKIRQARKQGINVMTEVLPYNAGSVFISAAVFDRDWQKIFNITYQDIQLASTGEWLTKQRFETLRKEQPNAAVIHHYVKEPWTVALVAADDVIISSDGLPALTKDINVPPQGIGSFAKILGQYVREQNKLSLMSALNKMSYLPAKFLQQAAPVFRQKGRLQVGMDADVIVFDPKTVRANTTYEKPHQPSTGMQTVLVGGQFVIKTANYSKMLTLANAC